MNSSLSSFQLCMEFNLVQSWPTTFTVPYFSKTSWYSFTVMIVVFSLSSFSMSPNTLSEGKKEWSVMGYTSSILIIFEEAYLVSHEEHIPWIIIFLFWPLQPFATSQTEVHSSEFFKFTIEATSLDDFLGFIFSPCINWHIFRSYLILRCTCYNSKFMAVQLSRVVSWLVTLGKTRFFWISNVNNKESFGFSFKCSKNCLACQWTDIFINRSFLFSSSFSTFSHWFNSK